VIAHRVLPVLEVSLRDGLIKLVLKLVVAVHCFSMVLVLGDKVKTINREFGFVNTLDQRVHPNSDTSELRVRVGKRGSRSWLGALVKQILNFSHLIKEEFVDQISGLLPNVVLNGRSPCHLEEVF